MARDGGIRRPGDPLTERPQIGRAAEDLAAAAYQALGYEIVARNWRRPEGEIDMVARLGDLLVFVEVRSRRGDEHGHPLESVTPRKQAQVIRSARYFLAIERPAFRDLRFDAVGVTFRPGLSPEVVRVEDAFRLDQ